MRTRLLILATLVPALCSAQLPNSSTATSSVRIMSVEQTQTVGFNGSLSQLHDRLQLTDAQQPAWTRYAASVQAYSTLFFSETQASAFLSEAAPRQVERIAGTIQNRLNALRDIERNTQALYAVLNPQQQKTADQHLTASIPIFGNSPSPL
jgi:hypothetical protein